MNDLISRQAAKNKKVYSEERHEYVVPVAELDWLPPAQPEQSSEIQDILEYLDTVLHPIISPDHWNVYSELHDMISMLPSAQPERKKGKWIYGEDEYGIDGYHCDKCGFFVPWDYAHTFINYIEDYNFCPNCGADMRGEQDG